MDLTMCQKEVKFILLIWHKGLANNLWRAKLDTKIFNHCTLCFFIKMNCFTIFLE